MLDLLKPPPQQDRRQSETALLVARGTRRLLRRLNFSTLTELPLISGRRADIVALSSNGSIFIVEIKSSLADCRSDNKWQEYRTYCDRFFFAIPESVPSDDFPQEWASFWPTPVAPMWCGPRQNIAWPRPAAPCFCVMPMRRP